MKLKEAEFYEVVWSVMLLGKNVYNATLFLLHNFILSYIYDKESKNYIQKGNLHPHQVVFESNKKKYKFSGKRN